MASAAISPWWLPEPEKPGKKIMQQPLLCTAELHGFNGGKKENKLGMRASETAEMIFDNCRIPDSNRLGKVGDGFKQSLKVLDGGRISIAALGVGIAKGAYEAAVKYSKERHQFDKPISYFQGISLNWQIWQQKSWLQNY